ncbi:hypothetical protein PIB30_092992, partial [Stylosanthes scabra]|nr:hypothetical protein [Stylosanthes scabra]
MQPASSAHLPLKVSYKKRLAAGQYGRREVAFLFVNLLGEHCNSARASINKFGPEVPSSPPFKSMTNKLSEHIFLS